MQLTGKGAARPSTAAIRRLESTPRAPAATGKATARPSTAAGRLDDFPRLSQDIAVKNTTLESATSHAPGSKGSGADGVKNITLESRTSHAGRLDDIAHMSERCSARAHAQREKARELLRKERGWRGWGCCRAAGGAGARRKASDEVSIYLYRALPRPMSIGIHMHRRGGAQESV